MDDKATLHGYLRRLRENLLATTDGLDEYDVRRPLTSSGTNLLGLLKHVAIVQAGYLGGVFGRPAEFDLLWAPVDGGKGDDDLWVPAHQTRDQVLELYRASAAHADATVEALPLDAVGHVPWWGDTGRVTLHRVLVHLVAETARHTGHADILRESLDGRLGNGPGDPNVAERTAEQWALRNAEIDAAARVAAGRA